MSETDWEPLGEDVSSHCVLPQQPHADGRACVYHYRLNAYAFGRPMNRRCLREHPAPASSAVPVARGAENEESACG